MEKLCREIITFKPDLVITEKGISGGWSQWVWFHPLAKSCKCKVTFGSRLNFGL